MSINVNKLIISSTYSTLMDGIEFAAIYLINIIKKDDVEDFVIKVYINWFNNAYVGLHIRVS